MTPLEDLRDLCVVTLMTRSTNSLPSHRQRASEAFWVLHWTRHCPAWTELKKSQKKYVKPSGYSKKGGMRAAEMTVPSAWKQGQAPSIIFLTFYCTTSSMSEDTSSLHMCFPKFKILVTIIKGCWFIPSALYPPESTTGMQPSGTT